MPELKEVFDMVTKQTEPDVGAWRDQEQRQRRAGRNRKISAYAVVAAIGIVATVIAVNALGADDTERTGAPIEPIPANAAHLVVDLETGNVSPLPSSLDGGYTYMVSPPGDEVAFAPWPDPMEGDNLLHVYVGSVDGTGVRRATPLSSGVDAVNPRWLPDGQIVFQGRDRLSELVGDLYLLDPPTGVSTKLTDLTAPNSPHWFMSASVRPDGQVILFNLPRGPYADQTWDLWTIPASGGEPTLLRREAAHGSYSPTDSTIAYLQRPGFDLESYDESHGFGAGAIWLADADGSDPRMLVGGELYWPRWSPDGTRIAYVDAGGVYVVDVATGDTSRVIDGEAPDWLDDHTLIVERA
ncbi:MAG TPA: hypothetical protein VMR89_11245 [Actinomycetota bacterium]|nr:hypothetical protein [Actinomycetota bacterium]